jgi:recombination associated protein RdgC
MWFRNLIFYRLQKPFTASAEALEEALESTRFAPCGSHQLSSIGWTSPMGKLSDMLVHAGSGALMICMKKEERILPASVIRDFVNEKVDAIEEAEMRKVRKKERDTIKDEVILDLTPKAFTRSACTWAIILPAQSLLIVDASSAGKADEFTTLLHKTLVDTPLILPQVQHAPADTLTLWLTSPADAPADIEIGDECELIEPGDEGGIVRCRRQDLGSDEIRAHLDAGKRAVKLGMTWDEKLSFVLAEDLSIKKLKYSDELVEAAADKGEADAAAQFDADFTLMTLEFARFVPRVLEFFGGEVVDD